MYQNHFGLQDMPFSISPDPRFLFMSERHREALAHLIYGIGNDGGFVLLTGDVGTGKTTVCRCLLEQVPDATDVALVLNPKLTAPELLAALCDELHIRYPEGTSSVKLLVDHINGFLLNNHAQGRKTVLIIDEAQNLAPEVLEQVRLLTNLETDRRKLLQIIMLGQPELRDMLARPEMCQLAQRITARYHLGPLSREEVAEYVAHRLGVAGLRRQIFPKALLRRLHRLSGGVPRLINIICDRALLGTYVQGRETVNRATLEEAAREVLDNHSRRPGRRALRPLLAIATAAVFIALFLGLQGGIGDLSPLPGTTATLNAAPTVSLTWPADQPISLSGTSAYQAVFARWGIEYGQGNGLACEFAQANGLSCQHQRGSLGRLRQINRPAVLKLFDDQGEEFFAALVSLRNQSATFIVGGEEITAPVEALEARWLGEFTVLWEAPSEFTGVIRPGDRGDMVAWLARQRAVVQGRESGALENPVLKGDLLHQLEEFQRTRGLAPDGIVGPQTLLYLRSASGEGPLLDDPKEKDLG
jgi:general secretion pathway protein A